jgi:hypothetical protein
MYQWAICKSHSHALRARSISTSEMYIMFFRLIHFMLQLLILIDGTLLALFTVVAVLAVSLNSPK